jgi:hypothetical protein
MTHNLHKLHADLLKGLYLPELLACKRDRKAKFFSTN